MILNKTRNNVLRFPVELLQLLRKAVLESIVKMVKNTLQNTVAMLDTICRLCREELTN